MGGRQKGEGRGDFRFQISDFRLEIGDSDGGGRRNAVGVTKRSLDSLKTSG